MSPADPERSLEPLEGVQQRIRVVRGRRVLLDQDLAALYGVAVKALNQAVQRNIRRFPDDFVLRLSPEEALAMRSQFVTASARNVRHPPLAFTEHGAIMAAQVLRSRRAEEAGILVVRAFVKFRQLLSTQRNLGEKLAELEHRIGTQDRAIQEILAVIRELMEPPEPPGKGRIGFR